MIKYMVTGTEIKPVVAIKETDKFVVVHNDFWGKDVRSAKRSSYENYFDTWQEAKDFLLADAEAKVHSSARRLDLAKEYLKKVKSIEEAI